ncbi:MAG: flagellar protein FlaG [Roseburia sp.]
MAIEGIKNSGMAYQGSVSVSESVKPVVKETAEPRNTGEGEAASYAPSENLQNINVKAQEEENTPSSRLKSAVESINKNSQATEAIFGIHEGTNRVTIKIVDKDTREVVKEYPPEKTLDMIEKVWEMAGLMVDEKR